MPKRKTPRATTIKERILYRLSEDYNPYFLDDHMGRVRFAESEGGEISEISSARGPYQFLTKGENNAFQTALKRVAKTYKQFGTVPDWVPVAMEHNDPMKLSQAQSDELYLGNIYQQKGSDEYFRKVLTGDLEAGANLYSRFHHTNRDIVKNDPRLSGIFGISETDVYESAPIAGRRRGGFIGPQPGRRFI